MPVTKGSKNPAQRGSARSANDLLPQLKVLGDSLIVQDGGTAVLTGRNLKAAPAHLGVKPLEFETAFTSEVRRSRPAGVGVLRRLILR